MAPAVNKKIGIITQARTTSTRLPGKVFKEAAGKHLLQYHIERLQQSGLPVYIATTVNVEDNAIALFAEQNNIPCWRGSEMNVLERFYDCAKHFSLDIIVRVTSDCPLIDGALIKHAVDEYCQWNDAAIYYSNGMQRTFPRGFDFEIFSFELLENAFFNATEWFQKEHVTPFINQNIQGNVVIKHCLHREDASAYRLTVDTQEDYILLRKLIEEYDAADKCAAEIILILKNNPHLHEINAHIEQKKLQDTQVKL